MQFVLNYSKISISNNTLGNIEINVKKSTAKMFVVKFLYFVLLFLVWCLLHHKNFALIAKVPRVIADVA